MVNDESARLATAGQVPQKRVQIATAANAVKYGANPMANMALAIRKARRVTTSATPKRAAILADVLLGCVPGVVMPPPSSLISWAGW